MTDMNAIDLEIERLQTSIQKLKLSNYDANLFNSTFDAIKERSQNKKPEIYYINLKNYTFNLFNVLNDINVSILKKSSIDDLRKLSLTIDSIYEIIEPSNEMKYIINSSPPNIVNNHIELLKNKIEIFSNNYEKIIDFFNYLKISKYLFKNTDINIILTNVELCNSFKLNGDAINQLKENSEKIENEHREILIRSKKGYDNSLVIQSNRYFHESSEIYEKNADLWGWFVAANFILAFILACWFYFNAQVAEDYFDLTKIFLSKFILFGVLVFGMAFGAKVYMANMHNYAVNRHKQNGLETFLSLANAATNEDKKDIILTYAANCIYSQQETGFNNQSSGGSNPSEQIAKVAEAIAKLAPKTSA